MADRQAAHHRQYNRATREAWEWYTAHRQRVADYLTEKPADSLAIWGAGNCNDLDLPRLTAHFQQIALYDLDVAAVEWGLEHQEPCDRPRIKVIQADAVELATSTAELPQFQVVASTGLLSQILHYAQLASTQSAEDLWPHLEALRTSHLQLLLRMAAPGGTVLLFNDFVSSETCGEIMTCAESELAAVVRRELACRNFFTGLHPGTIDRLLRSSPQLTSGVADCRLSPPWRWQIGPHKCYAVCLHQIATSKPAAANS